MCVCVCLIERKRAKLRMNFVRTSYELRTNFVRTSYELRTKSARSPYRFHFGSLGPSVYELRTNFVRTSYELRTKFARTLSPVHPCACSPTTQHPWNIVVTAAHLFWFVFTAAEGCRATYIEEGEGRGGGEGVCHTPTCMQDWQHTLTAAHP